MNKQIVLNLTKLCNASQLAIAHYAQKMLFGMGFFWSHIPEQKGMTPVPDLAYLVINFWPKKYQKLTGWHTADNNIEQMVEFQKNGAIVLDAASDLDMFLNYAGMLRDLHRVDKLKIQGVNVTITKDDIRPDATALLREVEAHALAYQQERFTNIFG